MSRQYNPAIDAYRNMDIENLPDANAEPETTGLLSKRRDIKTKGLDMDNPAGRDPADTSHEIGALPPELAND